MAPVSPPTAPPPPAATPPVGTLPPAPPSRFGAARILRLVRHPNPRWLLAVLLVTTFIVTIVSAGTAWWAYTANGGGTSHSLYFLPGGDYNVTCSGSDCAGFSAGSFPYNAIGGSLGGLYGTVLGLLGFAIGLTGLAAVIAVLSLLGRRTGWWQRSGTFILVVLAFLVMVVAEIAAVTSQPGAFSSTTKFPGLGAGGASPLTSFWGSSGSASWGAGAGWYLGLSTVILLVGVAAVLVLAGPKRLELPARARRTPTNPSPLIDYSAAPSTPTAAYFPPPSEYTPPPAATPYARSPVTRPPITFAPGSRVTPRPAPKARTPTPAASAEAPPPDAPVSVAPRPAPVVPVEGPEMINCPECGTENLAKSRTCSYCQRSLRPS